MFTPELVDIKITNYCDTGCKFCYQNSGTNGKHAEISVIRKIADVLKKCEVFEVAIGGGDPVLHPGFLNILEIFTANGIVANFSTSKTSLLCDQNIMKDIRSGMGGTGKIGISINNDNKLKIFIEEFSQNCSYNIKDIFTVHHVLGVSDMQTTENMINTCNSAGVDILLLGFKNTGRAVDCKKHDYSKMIEVLKKFVDKGNQSMSVAIDTSVAAEFKDRLKHELGVDDRLMSFKEGEFSMYVDAVDMFMARDSYSGSDRKDIDIKSFCRKDVEDFFVGLV